MADVTETYSLNFETNAQKATGLVSELEKTLSDMGRSGELATKGLNTASRGVLSIEKALGGASRSLAEYNKDLRKTQELANAKNSLAGATQDARWSGMDKLSVATEKAAYAQNNLAAAQRAYERLTPASSVERQISVTNRLSEATRENTRAQETLSRQTNGSGNSAFRASEGFVALRYAMYDVGRTALTASAAITGTGVAALTAFASQERAFTEVERIAEGSVSEVQHLRKELMDMSTEIPRSFQELSEIASLGGALGIDSSALDEFTSTVAKFVTLTGVTEDAATTGFGRISQYLNVVEEDYDKLGSAILRAGNISVATEEQVLKFSSAIALPAARAGLLADEVVALGAATASFANINVEGAGSAFSRVFANIERSVSEGGESLDKFAAAAGYSSEQFKVAWGSDSGGTFNRIIQGLSQDVDGLVGSLDTLGIRNERDRRVVSALALNYQDYMRIVGETSNAWREGIYMNEAYGLVLDDLSSKWTIFQNSLSNAAAAVGAEFAPAVSGLLTVTTDLLVNLAEFASTPMGEVMIRIAGTVAVLAAATSALVGVMALAGGSALAFRFALQQIAGSGVGAALSGLITGFRATGGAASGAATGVGFLSAALKTLGRVTVVGALIYAVSELLFNTRESLIWVGEAFIWLADTVVDAMSQISPFLGMLGATTTHVLRGAGQNIKKWGETFPETSNKINDTSGSLDDFNSLLEELEQPDLSDLNDGLGGVGDSAKEASEQVRTLVDYANDLSSVWKRAFDIRFGAEDVADGIADSFQKLKDQAEASAQKIRDLKTSIQSLSADKNSLKAEINTLEYYLKIAQAYGDTKRATELEAELGKKRAELAKKTNELADKQKDLKKEQDSQSKSLTGNTQAARDNRDTIRDLVSKYQDQIEKLAASGLSQDELRRKTAALREDFIRQATQLGYNRKELEKYAKGFDDVAVAINNVPRNVTVKANTDPAIQALNEFQAKVKSSMVEARNTVGKGVSIPITSSFNGAPMAKSARGMNIEAAIAQANADLKRAISAGNDRLAATKIRQIQNWTELLNSGNYAEGGYTGPGGKYEPAGIVHKGEYVLRKDQVNQRTGLPYASALGQLMGGAPSRTVAPAASAPSNATPEVSLSAGTIQAIAQATGKAIYLDGKLIADAVSNSYAQQNTVGAY